MINCYILDDLPSQFKVLEVLISRHPDLQLAGKSTSPIKFLEEFNAGKIDIDLLFLDIEMPVISGIEIAQMLQSQIKIIFTTGHRDYAFDAYESEAVDYLLKPIHPERFEKAIEKYFQVKTLELQKLSPFNFGKDHLVTNGIGKASWIKIKHEEILYLKADKNYTDVHLFDRKITLYGTIRKIVNMLPGFPFIQIHRQYVVNFNHVVNGSGKFVMMSNETQIPVGRIYAHQIKMLLKS